MASLSRRPKLGMGRMGRIAAAGALGVTLAGGLIASQTVNLGGGGSAPPAATARADIILHKAAAAATQESAARQGDFAYLEWKATYHSTHSPKRGGRPDVYSSRYHRMQWRSVDGSRPGLYRTKGTATGLDLKLPEGTTPAESVNGEWRSWRTPRTEKPGLQAPTYAFMRSLPSDPDELHSRIDRFCATTNYCDSDGFARISDLLTEHVVPADKRAALFEAMTKINGTSVVEGATLPATGERGVAVAKTTAGTRTELVFDPQTYELLGKRQVVVKNVTDPGTGAVTLEAGTVKTSIAILQKALVDKVGQQP